MENKMHAKYTASHTGIPLQMQQAFVEAANDAWWSQHRSYWGQQLQLLWQLLLIPFPAWTLHPPAGMFSGTPCTKLI